MEWRYKLVLTLMMIMVVMSGSSTAKDTKQLPRDRKVLGRPEILVEHDFPMQGDSGGSVMHLEGQNYESIGIVSWGVEGCQVN